MYPLHDIYDVAVDLHTKLRAPPGAISISSHKLPSDETILIVHLRPQFKYLTASIPTSWMGYRIEFDISALPSMNEQSNFGSKAQYAY